jgi:hypothetical protein
MHHHRGDLRQPFRVAMIARLYDTGSRSSASAGMPPGLSIASASCSPRIHLIFLSTFFAGNEDKKLIAARNGSHRPQLPYSGRNIDLAAGG